ncbi:hypothetical protein [Dyadobacter alkalitolerans]|uniref:hypothetical protein n=1 Tax=Dyadobacter alkalitolerans TaxID=492736 RepID=UPI00047A8370|nr:hypothetical protein [Dyadobacter alkalitolerans]
MLSAFRNELAPIQLKSSIKPSFEKSLLDYKRLYPSARFVQNYGHTFFIEESIFLFIAFKGTRATKPVVNTRFESLNALNTYYYSFVNKVLKTVISRNLRKSRATKKNIREIKPGAIFYSSPCNNQADIEFFQIITVKGRLVVIQKIKQIRTYQATNHGLTIGVKDSFIDAPIRLRIGDYGMRIDALHYLSCWDKKAVYWSSCA